MPGARWLDRVHPTRSWRYSSDSPTRSSSLRAYRRFSTVRTIPAMNSSARSAATTNVAVVYHPATTLADTVWGLPIATLVSDERETCREAWPFAIDCTGTIARTAEPAGISTGTLLCVTTRIPVEARAVT